MPKMAVHAGVKQKIWVEYKWSKFSWQKVEPLECFKHVWDISPLKPKREHHGQDFLNLKFDEILRTLTTGNKNEGLRLLLQKGVNAMPGRESSDTGVSHSGRCSLKLFAQWTVPSHNHGSHGSGRCSHPEDRPYNGRAVRNVIFEIGGLCGLQKSRCSSLDEIKDPSSDRILPDYSARSEHSVRGWEHRGRT